MVAFNMQVRNIVNYIVKLQIVLDHIIRMLCISSEFPCESDEKVIEYDRKKHVQVVDQLLLGTSLHRYLLFSLIHVGWTIDNCFCCCIP